MTVPVPWTMNPDEVVAHVIASGERLHAVRTLTGVRLYRIDEGWMYDAVPANRFSESWYVRAWHVTDSNRDAGLRGGSTWLIARTSLSPEEIITFMLASEVYMAEHPDSCVAVTVQRPVQGGTWMFAEQAPEFVVKAIIQKVEMMPTFYPPPSHPRFR